MTILILGVWHASLKEILEKLEENEEVKASSHLSERIQKALLFLSDAGKLVEGANQELNELSTKLSECLNLSKGHIEEFQALLPHYANMVKAGANAEFIAKVALLEGINLITCIKLLRSLFQLDLPEAQEIIKKVKTP